MIPLLFIALLSHSHITESADPVETALTKASEWLLQQRLPDWSWGGKAMTPRAILALQVINNSTWFSGENLESQLSGKQLELEVSLQLWRHHEAPMTPGRLALYSLALNAICHDPRQFHGHDLIGSLLHHEPGLEFEFALTSLAVCSSGAHVRKRQLRHLLDIAERLSDPNMAAEVFPTDTLSMVLLALNCITRDHRNRNLDHYVKKPLQALANTQAKDGSFGGVHSTALATQALLRAENATQRRQTAQAFLLSHQKPDGSWGDVFTTTEVVLGLTKGLSFVREVACNSTVSPGPLQPLQPVMLTPPGTVAPESSDITIYYTLWVGTNVSEKHTLPITVPRNSTFYTVMQVAAERDPHFVFSATEWPNGHYVHTLAGYKEEPSQYYYWLLYVIPGVPDIAHQPGNQLVSPVGVDGLIVEDGGHYLFWYKKL